MNRAAYDRQRAEYIKSHTREERIRLAWIMTAYIAGYIESINRPDLSESWDFAYSMRTLKEEGVDIRQADDFCESVRVGITSPVLQSYARHAAFAFYALLAYVDKEGELDRNGLLREVEKWNLSKHTSDPGCLLRLAFREAEHALITLPRTTIPKKETVADATHSS